MARYVAIVFEIAEPDADRPQDELDQQAEDFITALDSAPSSWTYNGSLVLDDAGMRHHRLTL